MDTLANTPNIEARIAAERQRLFDEQALQVELEKQRIIPLEQGNDDVLDAIEEKITKSIERTARIQERIERFETHLAEAKATDESIRLDELAAAAERARIEGEKIIRTEYVKAANALAAVLAKLKEKDDVIDAANPVLEKHKRPTIASPNNIRCRPAEQFEWTERKVVTAGDPSHPHFANAERMPHNGNLPPAYRDRDTREVIQPVEADVPHSTFVPNDYAEPLYQAITLPAIAPAPRAYVHANGKQAMVSDKPAPIWQGEIKTGFFPS